MNKLNLNKSIHEKIINASKLFLQKEYDQNVNIVDALDLIEEIKNSNLNDVTEVYIYEEGFGDTEKKLKDTIVHLITSTISYNYKEENIIYLQNIIISEDTKKSDIALDYFLKIGAYHKEFNDLVLTFVENNVNKLTKNKLNTTAFYLYKIYNKNSRTTTLFNLVNKLHSEKYPSQNNENRNTTKSNDEHISKNIKQNTNKKNWWKFW